LRALACVATHTAKALLGALIGMRRSLFPGLLFVSASLFAQNKHVQPAFLFPRQITHVVVILQENRTPDNLFHFLSPQCPIPQGASGLSACTPIPVTSSCYNISPCGLSNQSGTVLPITLTGVLLQVGGNDPNHSHKAFSEMCDPDPANGYACRNDGAWRIANLPGTNSYGYVLNPAVTNYDGTAGHLLDPYLTFAEQYGWANFMYQTNQGPSYPAHQFIFSGTSARSTAEDSLSTFVAENFSGALTPAGCLAPSGAKNWLISPVFDTIGKGCLPYDDGLVQECSLINNTLIYPSNPVGVFCDDKPSMGSALDAQRITWKYYAPSAGAIWTAPDSNKDICVPQFTSPTTLECAGKEWNANVDVAKKGTDILGDITNCNLSSVSWVIPNGNWSDHAGATFPYGPSWVAAVINSLGQNPTCAPGTTNAGERFWDDTAIIVTWDDWGGWSDHEPPPLLSSGLPCTSNNCQADYQLGFRVPLVVVSAYTPQGYISNNSYDFGSILRTIEGVYGIREGELGVADARATTDLRDFFTGAFRDYTPVPAEKPASYFLGAKAQAGPPTPPDNDGDDD
jgi:hypothetical protein